MNKKRVKELVGELKYLVSPNNSITCDTNHAIYITDAAWFHDLEDLLEDFEEAISEPSNKKNS